MNAKKIPATADSKKGLSLKTTIFGLMLAGSIIPLGLYANFSYNSTKERITESTELALSKDNQSNARTVQSWISGNEQAIRASSVASELGTMDPGIVREFMIRVNAELPVFYAIIAIGKDGVQIARSNIDKLINVGDRPYFKKSIEGVPSTIQSAISKTTGKSFFTIAVPIRNPQKEIVGVLSALAESAQITDKVTGSKIGKTGFSYLASADGSILAHPDIKKIGTKVSDGLLPIMSADKQGRVTNFTTPDNIDVRVTASSAGNDLVLLSQIDEAEVDQPLRDAQKSLLFFVLSALGLTILLSWFLSNSIASKINELSRIADKISKARNEMDLAGMEKQIEGVGGAREIRQMGAAINRLGKSIRLAMRA